MSNDKRYLEIGERPWGKYFVLADEKTFKMKIIEVNPGQRLSLQSHKYRSENWVCVVGEATVEIGLEGQKIEKMKLQMGESSLIPQGAKHRLSNETNQPIKIAEVQTGTYFGEDDIERFEDDYERV